MAEYQLTLTEELVSATSYDIWVNGRKVRNVVISPNSISYTTRFKTHWVPIGSHISVASRNSAGVAPRTYCGTLRRLS